MLRKTSGFALNRKDLYWGDGGRVSYSVLGGCVVSRTQ